MFYLLVFSTLTAAQRGAKLLMGAGIYAYVMKSPSTIVTEGCNHGVRVGYAAIEKTMRILKSNRHMPAHVYLVDAGGGAREVYV